MKNFIAKYGTVIAAFMVFLSRTAANGATLFYYNQPKLPEKVKDLRKF